MPSSPGSDSGFEPDLESTPDVLRGTGRGGRGRRPAEVCGTEDNSGIGKTETVLVAEPRYAIARKRVEGPQGDREHAENHGQADEPQGFFEEAG